MYNSINKYTYTGCPTTDTRSFKNGFFETDSKTKILIRKMSNDKFIVF